MVMQGCHFASLLGCLGLFLKSAEFDLGRQPWNDVLQHATNQGDGEKGRQKRRHIHVARIEGRHVSIVLRCGAID